MTAMKRIAPVVLILAALAATGCTKKHPAPAAGALPEETVPSGMVPPAQASAPEHNSPRLEGDPLGGDLDDVNAYVREKGLIGDVYFDFDRAQLSNESVERLRQNAVFMRAHPQFVFTIEGHCDDRDTIEYNLALGQRRAGATQDYLSDLNVARDRMQTVSFGKERPVCEQVTDDCRAKNRRAHFVIAERRAIEASR